MLVKPWDLHSWGETLHPFWLYPWYHHETQLIPTVLYVFVSKWC
jgi:hypothetical protein